MKNAALNGKSYAGNPHVRFDEGTVASYPPTIGRPEGVATKGAKLRRGSLLYKTNSIAVSRKVAIAGMLAILGVTASAHVFDDVKILHFGLKDLPGQMATHKWYTAAPDYRHLSTWNATKGGDTHLVKVESDQSIINIESVTSDVSTPTLARTLKNEPCIRVNQSRIITTNGDGVTTSTNLPHGAFDFAGATCSKTKAAWTVLIRFRPDMKGYVRPNDTEWWRLFGIGWENGKHGMMFGFGHIAGKDDQMQLYFLHGASGVSPVGYSSMVVHDQVWNEIAVIVDGNTLRVGLCNEKINMYNDARIGPGQWVWNTKTYTFPAGTDFCPSASYTGVLSFGRNANPSAQLTAPRGDFHLVAFWDRPLSDHEVYEAFGAGHTPLVAVGGEASGFAADAFQGDTTKDVAIADNRPTSWQQIPSKLVQGKKLTIPFTAQGWHMRKDPTHKNMPQVLRIPCDAATTAVGAQLKVTLDSAEIGKATMVAGKVNNELMIPQDLFSAGDHNLVLERIDSGAGDLVIDGVFAEGSWRVGDADRITVGGQPHQLVYAISADYQGNPMYDAKNKPTEIIPREFDVLSGCWRDCSEFARNSWNNIPNKDPAGQQGPSRVTFDVPDDLYDAHYRYRFKFQLYGTPDAGKDKNGNYRCKYVVNGVTNVYGAASMTENEFSFDISDRIVRGRNVVELVDDEIGKTVDKDGNWTWDNWFVQIRYWAMDIVHPKRGLMIVVQ